MEAEYTRVETDKRKQPEYVVDFVTALPVAECVERLDRQVALPPTGLQGWLAPLEQTTHIEPGGRFVVERTYPGAIHPIRLVGHLDPDEDTPGTWVHGAITHDTYNQVLVEGLIIFATFFLLAVLFYLRLRTRGVLLALPLLILTLSIFALRWRQLRRATIDTARWVRRRLYLTTEQVRAGR